MAAMTTGVDDSTWMGVEDRELVAEAAAGDAEGFAELFRRHAVRLSRVAFVILHDEAAAEDAVQETFRLAFEHLADYRGDAEPLSWLYSIALNVCRTQLRRAERRPSQADTTGLNGGRLIGMPNRGVLTSVARRELNQKLAIALGFLSEAQKEVFVLHYVEGLPFEKIGELLGLNLNTALSLGHRARQVLARHMPRLARELGAD